jgi:hypothetical protein
MEWEDSEKRKGIYPFRIPKSISSMKKSMFQPKSGNYHSLSSSRSFDSSSVNKKKMKKN